MDENTHFDEKLLKRAEKLNINTDLAEDDEQLEYLIDEVEKSNHEQAEEIDDDIDEAEALKRAADEGIEFKDTWVVDDPDLEDNEFDSEKKALKAAKNDRTKVTQRREQV